MKMLKLCVLILLAISLLLDSALTKTAEKEKADSQKNFLKADKTLNSKADSSMTVNIQLATQTSTATSLPVVGNHKLEGALTDEDKSYELERANAMAEMMF